MRPLVIKEAMCGKFLGFRQKTKEKKKNIVICRICKVQMKYHSTTSGLRAHLITIHPGKLGELESEDPQLKQARIRNVYW